MIRATTCGRVLLDAGVHTLTEFLLDVLSPSNCLHPMYAAMQNYSGTLAASQLGRRLAATQSCSTAPSICLVLVPAGCAPDAGAADAGAGGPPSGDAAAAGVLLQQPPSDTSVCSHLSCSPVQHKVGPQPACMPSLADVLHQRLVAATRRVLKAVQGSPSDNGSPSSNHASLRLAITPIPAARALPQQASATPTACGQPVPDPLQCSVHGAALRLQGTVRSQEAIIARLERLLKKASTEKRALEVAAQRHQQQLVEAQDRVDAARQEVSCCQSHQADLACPSLADLACSRASEWLYMAAACTLHSLCGVAAGRSAGPSAWYCASPSCCIQYMVPATRRAASLWLQPSASQVL